MTIYLFNFIVPGVLLLILVLFIMLGWIRRGTKRIAKINQR